MPKSVTNKLTTSVAVMFSGHGEDYKHDCDSYQDMAKTTSVAVIAVGTLQRLPVWL